MFSIPANFLAFLYSFTHSYAAAIGLITVAIMLLITPLTLKSTKGMLEMQRLQPEMKRLQAQYKNDRQKLNEEMMKLYQEHKVNPLASCLPLLAQMPVFIIMFRVIRGLSYHTSADPTFKPKYIAKTSKLYISLAGKTEMKSLGLDLAKTPKEVMASSFGKGLVYAGLVLLLAVLYWVQQKQIASRTVNPSMSAGQQKLMQYLPVGFAVIQLFFPTGLVLYYLIQTVLRIAQQGYITRRFYHGDESLGRQAQRAGHEARELSKKDKPGGGDASGTTKTKPGRPAPSGGTTPKKGSGSTAFTAGGTKNVKPTPRDQGNGKSAREQADAASNGGGRPRPSGRVTPPKAPSSRPAPAGERPARPSGQGGSNSSRHPKPKKN